LCLVIEN